MFLAISDYQVNLVTLNIIFFFFILETSKVTKNDYDILIKVLLPVIVVLAIVISVVVFKLWKERQTIAGVENGNSNIEMDELKTVQSSISQV